MSDNNVIGNVNEQKIIRKKCLGFVSIFIRVGSFPQKGQRMFYQTFQFWGCLECPLHIASYARRIGVSVIEL